MTTPTLPRIPCKPRHAVAMAAHRRLAGPHRAGASARRQRGARALRTELAQLGL